MGDEKSKLRHPEFARRFQLAADGNPRVPPPNYGRLKWFVEEIEKRFGREVTVETVRKWMAGETLPRHELMAALAVILEVDPAWLSLGRSNDVPEKERRLRNAAAEGIVNVLTGYIAMSGGRPAYPADDDARAKKTKIDLYAVIKGAHYAFSVTLGERQGDGFKFSVPAEALGEAVLIGALRTSEFCVEFGELDAEMVRERGTRRGEVYNLLIPTNDESGAWKRINSFGERL